MKQTANLRRSLTKDTLFFDLPKPKLIIIERHKSGYVEVHFEVFYFEDRQRFEMAKIWKKVWVCL